MILEAGVYDIESALIADSCGVARLELCDNRNDGGTTPSYGLIKKVIQNVKAEVNVIIRPRAGNFCYSENEFEVMKEDVTMARELGCDGIVTGILKNDFSIDVSRMRELINLAHDMSVTFHMAIDYTKDLFCAIEQLKNLKVDRILTGGKASKAIEGIETLRQMQKMAGDSIVIMPGNIEHVKEIAFIKKSIAPEEIHFGLGNAEIIIGDICDCSNNNSFYRTSEKKIKNALFTIDL